MLIGTRLGPYEILGKIGEGGMGEVYRARDSRLGRTVAVKVLPPDASADASARARFEREARAIAALQHPNICVVHDVGRDVPSDSSGQPIDYLVMELLAGETLAERLARSRGPLPLDEVLGIGAAIADALDKAHRAGIVHRDLKPLNVMLTKSGPKLLDFGLAKLHDTASPVSLAADTAATTVAPGTAKGTILGTIHYMSPEQVEGRDADSRSDIWALGAVLYQMATGQRPFDGESAASVLGAILKDTPPPLSARQPLSPRLLDRTVQRCLAKDPDTRWQSAGDLGAELTWLLQEHSGSSPVPTQGGAQVPTARQGRTAWVLAAVATVTAVLLAIPAARGWYPVAADAQPETRLEMTTPATDDPLSFALSPDGRQMVFTATGDGGSRLWLRSLSSTTAQPLAGTEGAAAPFWSPDGRSIAFVSGNSLRRLDLGGAVHTLAPVTGIGGGSWNTNGVILTASNSSGNALFQIPASGGPATPVGVLAARQSSHRWPTFLPDGEHFLFSAQGSPDVNGVYLGALDGREPTRLVDVATAPAYLPTGWLLWTRGTTLMAQRLDIEGKRLTGEPLSLADDVAVDARFGRTALSVSADGTIAYRTGTTSRQLIWFDRSGATLGTAGEPDRAGLETPRLSNDGRQLAVGRAVQGNQDIWLLDRDRARRLTFDATLERFPLWSPDGSRLVFMSNRIGTTDLFTKLMNGSGTEAPLVTSGQSKIPTSWSSDGRYVIYHSLERDTSADLWVMPMTGQQTPTLFLRTPFREAWGAFSPDGRWIAYQSNESGRPEVYVRAFTPPSGGAVAGVTVNAGEQWQVSTTGGLFPVWRHDGKELFFLDLGGAMMAAPVETTNGTFNPGAPARLFQTRIVGAALGNQVDRQYDVASDGRFLLNVDLAVAAAPITLLQHWNPPTSR